jgi:hypothetical protein
MLVNRADSQPPVLPAPDAGTGGGLGQGKMLACTVPPWSGRQDRQAQVKMQQNPHRLS